MRTSAAHRGRNLALLALASITCGCVSYHDLHYSEAQNRIYIVQDTHFLGIGSSSVLACDLNAGDDPTVRPSQAECSEIAMGKGSAPASVTTTAPALPPPSEPEPDQPATQPPPTTSAQPPPPPPPKPDVASCQAGEGEVPLNCPQGGKQIKLCTSKDGKSCRFLVGSKVFSCAPNCSCDKARQEAEGECKGP